MEQFYFNGQPYIIQGIELHMRNAITGLDELVFFKDPTNVQCTTELYAIGGNNNNSVSHHISFDCGDVSFANVHTISKVEDPEKAMTPPESEDNSDDSFISW